MPTARELSAIVPEFSALSDESGRAAALALADVSAPCAPCERPLTMLSDCALKAPAGCENLPRLLRRVARAAQTETNPERLRALVAYGDVWVSGAAPPEPKGRIPLELWLDPQSPLAPRVREQLAQLTEGQPVDVTVRDPGAEPELAQERGVRSSPTWIINGYRLRGFQSNAALGMTLHRELAQIAEETP